MTEKSQSMDDLFLSEEAAALEKAKKEIAEEDLRYRTDPEYRARIDTERKLKAEEHERRMAEQETSGEPEDEDEDNEDENDPLPLS